MFSQLHSNFLRMENISEVCYTVVTFNVSLFTFLRQNNDNEIVDDDNTKAKNKFSLFQHC